MTDNSPFITITSDDSSSDILASTSSTNVLDQLKKAIQKKVSRPEVFIEVPERPGVSIRVLPNINQQQLKSWRKNAGEDSKQGMDTLKFACSVIGHTTTGIAFNGEVVSDDNGVELTFASPSILEMTGTTRPLPDCVKAFFGIDPHIEAAAVAIMESAGYGDSVDAVDPTKGSSTN